MALRDSRVAFGKRVLRVDPEDMKNDFSSHIPFVQLPAEARVLFSILLMTIYGPERPLAEKVFADLGMIWDSEELAPGDFVKPGRIQEVFDKYAAIFRKDAWWLDAFGVSREQAERQGFFEWKQSRRTEIKSPSNSARG